MKSSEEQKAKIAAEMVPKSQVEDLERELRELRIWKESNEGRKARLFRPLKGGAKVVEAMSEKLDFTEFRGKLRSTGKSMW